MLKARALFVVLLLSLALTTRIAGAVEGEGGAGDGVEEVVTSRGMVRGRRAQDGNYVAFLGIPYGAPPVGENRFKPSRPAAGWTGVQEERVALCPQASGGGEDCLQLHVAAPPAPRTALPVLVHVHGGGFVFGRAQTKGLGPVVSEGVIVVSLSYRLGSLGFLCLGTSEAPGNAALYDVILALRWVRDNIVAFGGDPTRVTASGISAGATILHLLALTNASDLYHQMICMDGPALTQFAVMPTPVTYARRYAELLGFNAKNVSDLTEFYQRTSADELASKSVDFFQQDSGAVAFAPCVERAGLPGLLGAAPAMIMDRFNKPTIFTYSNYEGSLQLQMGRFEKLIDRYNEEFASFVPSNLEFPDDVRDEKIDEIKKFYFGNDTITRDNVEEYVRYWGDNEFVFPALASARAVRAPAYLLEFAHIGELSQDPSLPGAGHGDIRFHLFPEKEIKNDEDRKAVRQLVKIVANFVKTGSPAIEGWVPLHTGTPVYLRLSNHTEVLSDPYPARMCFWDRLYSRYRKTDYVLDYETMFDENEGID